MKVKYVFDKISKRFISFKHHPLTKQNPSKALFRYVKFNFIQYIYNKPRVYDWIDGLKFYAQKGDAGIVANIYFRLFDYEESMFLIHNLKENELFVDIGANVGHFSLLAAGICKAQVIAFEPIPLTFNKLKKNIDLNKLSEKVSLFKIGIGEENSLLNFTTTKDVMNGVAMEYETEVVSVEVKKLDDIPTVKNATFLKIDVEGYEFFVLKGASKVLKSEELKFIIIELNFSTLKFGHTSEEIFRYLSSFGFIPISYDTKNKEMIRLESFNSNKFNTIFVKKDFFKC
ncbi:methyltransferase, FkbM family [Flavobacterium flevense]|uniref:Methyltransferase FkbM domain-containing protein n=1 Tax=Flavobacterium flevense TaxID=983 RepID=A0A4Y4AYV6_9FLAO|nr:FkbM family methyltransferase [Flavobacterium flevense]GEC73461.1 hypothetical protein FFL01_30000 [Flavobacterium flevense]SHM00162.1 methyltransferase, FkbM family [Flavobacterium flevense]